MKYGVLSALLALAMSVLISQSGYAQFSVQHQPPTVMDRNSVNTLEFLVPGVSDTDVLEALLFYRNEGDLGFSQKEIEYRNGTFTARISPEELSGNTFEYYFQLNIRNQVQDIFFPENLAAENPVEVQIIDEPSEVRLPKAEGIDYTILSPAKEGAVAPADFYIAIALFYNVNEIPEGRFRLLLNGEDVTAAADTSDYFISYVPQGQRRGRYRAQLLYETPDEILEVTSWSFSVVDPDKAQYTGLTPRLIPTGRIELTARNQVIAGDNNNAFTGRSYLSGSYGLLKYSVNGFFTSQESSRLQPQNRYGLDLQLGKWWKLQAGHVYPSLGRFTISGRRIYGINTSLHLLWEGLNIQFLYGELSRKVTNRYTAVSVDTVLAGGAPQDTTYTLGYEDAGRGTFSRKVIGGRIGIGNPRKFQFGLQAMKVQDDTTSIFNVVDFNDLLAGPNSLYSALTFQDLNKLNDNPDLLQVQGGSRRPQGNFIAGADLRFSLSDNKIRFRTETVASALNNDIYGGVLDSLRAADIGFEDLNQEDLDILDRLSRFIIINENMSVLPIRLKNFNTDSSEAEAYFPTSILGSNTELTLNYPGNTFTAQYRWVGPEFVSLANSTIRRDIAGFTFTDRFRLMENQLFITLGFEALNDNVANTKEATTNTLSYRTNVSWYPVREKLPKVSAGFRFRTRNNGIERFNPEVPGDFENAAVQNIRIVEGDTLTTTIPRVNNTLNLNFSVTQQLRFLDMVHDATLSISTLRTQDDVFAYGDARNAAVSMNLGTRFEEIPLRTQLGMTINNTEAGSGQLNIDIFGMYAGGTYFMLDGKLSLNGRLAFTSNISRTRALQVEDNGDDDFLNDYYVLSQTATRSKFGTFVLLGGAEYRLDQNHSFIFDSNFTNVTGENSLNDRIVQLRYVYRF